MRRIYVALVISAAAALVQCAPARAEIAPPYWTVIMAEAVSEGYDGMYAVACVIRNRGGDLHGFCGARRKGLQKFCKAQGDKYIRMAKQIEDKVFHQAGPDTTLGSTHFENVTAFGRPKWARGMVVTRKIGSHTFFRKK